jgi:hypothetical protein
MLPKLRLGFAWPATRSQALDQVLEHGYGHHIQRRMVTGNLALVAGVHPREISDWYLGMYVDALDRVTLPNKLGMVMYADESDVPATAIGHGEPAVPGRKWRTSRPGDRVTCQEWR